jgi:hypothetical protein
VFRSLWSASSSLCNYDSGRRIAVHLYSMLKGLKKLAAGSMHWPCPDSCRGCPIFDPPATFDSYASIEARQLRKLITRFDSSDHDHETLESFRHSIQAPMVRPWIGSTCICSRRSRLGQHSVTRDREDGAGTDICMANCQQSLRLLALTVFYD